jgi:mediator of RNA polymerase II transcription subunit 21
MLQELTHMDRITQLQDEIQQLLTIMSNSIAYLTSRADFVQVSPDVPVTKHRNPAKFDEPAVFDGARVCGRRCESC